MTHFIRKELKYPDKVQAFILTEFTQLQGAKGDYLMIAPNGKVTVVESKEFKAIYRTQSVLQQGEFQTYGSLIWANPRSNGGGLHWIPEPEDVATYNDSSVQGLPQ